jgi:hypothetical protein
MNGHTSIEIFNFQTEGEYSIDITIIAEPAQEYKWKKAVLEGFPRGKFLQ